MMKEEFKERKRKIKINKISKRKDEKMKAVDWHTVLIRTLITIFFF